MLRGGAHSKVARREEITSSELPANDSHAEEWYRAASPLGIGDPLACLPQNPYVQRLQQSSDDGLPTDLHDQLVRALHARYDVDRLIGTGGMATVYLARDRRHERLVAIKVLDPELAAAVGAERFVAE